MKPLCIYHKNCVDGFTSAWIVRKALGPEVEFYAATYNDPPPDVAGRTVVIVDFSYKMAEMAAMGAVAESIMVLDHHKTAEVELAPFRLVESSPGAFVYGDVAGVWRDFAELGRLRIAALFDADRSGAQITWDFFRPGEPRPLLVDYTADQDLWQFRRASSREVNAYIYGQAYEFEVWDRLDQRLRNSAGVRRCADKGEAIFGKARKDVEEAVEATQRRMTIGGYNVPVANVPHTMTSDAGHLMCGGEPFAACYWDSPSGRKFSLRSAHDGLDVAKVAEGYGGGGHPHAAGFRRPIGWEGEN